MRKTPRGKFVWDRGESGAYYLEWYEDGKRRRARAQTRPAEVLEACRRKILELKGRAVERGRTVSPTAGEEETAVPITQTIDAYLNHVKVNQKLNTYRRYRSVRTSATTSHPRNTSTRSPAPTSWNTGIFERPASPRP